jgi:hypothetical protein
MKNNLSPSGRNCSFFPISRGRLEPILKMTETNEGLSFYIPSRFYVGKIFSRIFSIYALLFIVAFIVLILTVNNGNFEIANLVEHPQLYQYLFIAASGILFSFILFMTIAGIKARARIEINRNKQTITAGFYKKSGWKSIVHEYRFSDIGAVEVLRNYEFQGHGDVNPGIQGNNVGRTSVRDSYELNLFFHVDDFWLGITESRKRPKILEQADLISRLTRVQFKENNVSNQNSPLSAQAKSPELQNLPPFLREQIGEKVHEVQVFPNKLKSKASPFKIEASDEIGQKFLDLVMPAISYFVNKIEYEKSLAALEFLCSDRENTNIRKENVQKLKAAGWKDEEELSNLLTRIYDANTGPVPGVMANRDTFERYYMSLKDRILVPSAKYRILFFEFLEKIIYSSAERITNYERKPGSLNQIQNSENYALKFIIGLGFGFVIVTFGFFTIISLIFYFNPDSPLTLLRPVILLGLTVGLIYLRRKLRKKFGK